MILDFIEIGTSDFETIIETVQDERGLSIDAVDLYLERLPNKPNVKKLNYAISNYSGEIDVYYVHPDDIEKHNLSWYLKGCNSVGVPHELTVKELRESNLENLLQKKKVPVLCWKDLISKFGIKKVKLLKIDAERHDITIVRDILMSNHNVFPETIVFEANEATPDNERIEIIEFATKNGYEFVDFNYKKDVILRHKKTEPKIALIQLWFGKIPDYFKFHLETTKNLKNVDFLFFTDQDLNLNLENYKVIKIGQEFIEKKVTELLNYDYTIQNIRKVNDLKSLYGELFEDYIQDYQYFGFYDIDTLMGDFNNWIFPHMPEYDVISFGDTNFHNRLGGPLTIIRNTYFNRRLYRLKLERFKETLNHDHIDAFEEQELNTICQENCSVKLLYESMNCETHNGGKNTYDCYWSGGKVFINGSEKLLYHFYRKSHTKFTKVGNVITANYNKKFIDDFYWVVSFTQNYEKLFMNLLDSIKKYSNRKCIIYSINYDLVLPKQDWGNEQFILKRIDIPEGDKDSRGRDNNIISCKPLINLSALDSFPNSKFVNIDSDIYFTVNSDEIRKYFSQLENYPLINSHIHDVFYVKNVREGEEWTSPLHVLLNAMGFQDEPTFPRKKTNVLIFDERSRWFFEKQMEIYHTYKKTEPGILLFHDEDTANAILSINGLNKCLPLVDIEEAKEIDMNVFSNYSYNMTPVSPNTKLPQKTNDVLFFHGVKSQEHFDKIKHSYCDKVLDSEEMCIFYKDHTFVLEKNSFIATKKFSNNVNINIFNSRRELIFQLNNQNLYNYWYFFINDFYLDKGLYHVQIHEIDSENCIYSDYFEV